MADGAKMLDRFKQVGSRFAFEMYIEVFYDNIIDGFRKFLSGYTPEDIKKMAGSGEFPYISPSFFDQLHGYEKYLEKITAERLAEAFATARPDLAEALITCGDEGGAYMHKLREHLLNLIKNPGKAHGQGGVITEVPKRRMKLLTCESCNQSWPVPEDEVDKVKECPFCHTGRDEPSPPKD